MRDKRQDLMRLNVFRLENVIRHYAWGSKRHIAELLGRPSPSEEPQAELWMGAHPQGSSQVEIGGVRRTLRQLIAEEPRRLLGRDAALGSGAAMPELAFLFKVLAAGEPLSVQAHPDRHQAVAGFAREEAAGIDRGAKERNYRDGNAKPEILLALTPFTLIRGFRPPSEIVHLLSEVGFDSDEEPLRRLRETSEDDPSSADANPLQAFFASYMALDGLGMQELIDRALGLLDDSRLEHRWIRRLVAHYPGDRGVFSPLWLHCFELQPGQAVFTGPGILHAYLEGLGIELMSSSDNVLRGGLTPKHVDIDELLAVVRFEAQLPEVLHGTARDSVELEFETPVEDFRLSRLNLPEGHSPFKTQVNGPEVLLCTAGSGRLIVGDQVENFQQGDVFFVAAAADRYEIQGHGLFFRAREAFAGAAALEDMQAGEPKAFDRT